ncbi:MAG: VOC family protein [Phenylobacterium sp.]|jgi:catechol 2,3-dioxygenase-like lactoylglutathione lyase family enzyme|uniref:VOC family protein n=1 Tax=Phenylobacterium sp. TaxID=1871053 RepID=UPI002A368D67|nr:VOC family protein [Phenylobacterium sp.]MDX9996955.1 VOC family protein [Phenylobacterium sp.]
MITGLDHIVVTAKDVEAAAAAFSALLGRQADWRGEEAWFQLSNTALRVGRGEADAIAALAFDTDDVDAAARLAQRRGLSGDASGFDVAGIPVRLVAPRAAFALSPASGRESAAVAALDHVVVRTRNIDRAVANFGGRLGLDLRLDRSNPAWGARQLFFRCGNAVVEFGASLSAPASDEPDGFGGLAWRVVDPDAARARLADAGFDVSEVRDGRKPGTKVFTVRSGVPGAPSLMIQQGAED